MSSRLLFRGSCRLPSSLSRPLAFDTTYHRPLETRRTLRTDVVDYTSITGDANEIREQRLKKILCSWTAARMGKAAQSHDKQLGKFVDQEQGVQHQNGATNLPQLSVRILKEIHPRSSFR